MLQLLPIFPLAQVALPVPPPAPPPAIQAPYLREVLQPHEVRPLPGQLDDIPVFNSNSPELVQSEGILLSTFPPNGMRTASAHLNYPLNGRFDVFAHHIARGLNPDDIRTLFLGVLVYNPNRRPVTLDLLQGATYLSQEAPFNDLPALVANPLGTVFAGPGSRTMNDVLRGIRQGNLPDQVVIPPQRSYLLVNAPIPLRSLASFQNGVPLPQYLVPFPLPGTALVNSNGTVTLNGTTPGLNGTTPTTPRNANPPTNGRSVLMHLSSSAPVYVASMSMYARLNADGSERAPSLYEWESLLVNGGLAGPRDRPPTPPGTRNYSRFYYGRVAGVAQGSEWRAQLTDPDSDELAIPRPGSAVSYGISMLDNGTFGTGQIQSAPMLVRYPDTAFRAHGNYGIRYNLTLPLRNDTDETQTVAIRLQTPLKTDERENGLRFLTPPDRQVFFRGTVRIRYNDDMGITETRYLHLIQRRGQEGEPLIRLTMPRGDRRLVQVDFIYPPDATPPQVLTVQTLNSQTP